MDGPAKDGMASLLMKADLREDVEICIFLNDTDTEADGIDSLLRFRKECGIKTIRWSQRDTCRELLS